MTYDELGTLLFITMEDAMDAEGMPHITTENDGIGAYEYWGMPCFDTGHDRQVIAGTDRTVTIKSPVAARRLIDKAMAWNVGEGSFIADLGSHVDYAITGYELVDGGVKINTEWDEVGYEVRMVER